MDNFITRLFRLLWDGIPEPKPMAHKSLPPSSVHPPAQQPVPAPSSHAWTPAVIATTPDTQPPPAQPAPPPPKPDPLREALVTLMRAAADERFSLPPRTRAALEHAERVSTAASSIPPSNP